MLEIDFIYFSNQLIATLYFILVVRWTSQFLSFAYNSLDYIHDRSETVITDLRRRCYLFRR